MGIKDRLREHGQRRLAELAEARQFWEDEIEAADDIDTPSVLAMSVGPVSLARIDKEVARIQRKLASLD